MTAEEVAYKYGHSTFTPSEGMTITDVVRGLYHSDDELYFRTLMELNHIPNWFDLKYTQVLRYLPEELIKFVDEYKD